MSSNGSTPHYNKSKRSKDTCVLSKALNVLIRTIAPGTDPGFMEEEFVCIKGWWARSADLSHFGPHFS